MNKAKPRIMHIDLNSCFASIEQQSRPMLRHRPVAIVNRRTENTSIITASYEAKKQGIGVGMRLTAARLLCPALIAIESDPPKYRYVYRKLMAILEDYSPKVRMKSIDEGLIDFSESPPGFDDLEQVGKDIKQRLRDEVGEYMRCNIGIGTNRFLAKTAASLHKPDGLDVIDHRNLREVYASLELKDLNGIANGYQARLMRVGITTPLEFLDADEVTLERMVFHGKCGRDWYRRLRGWEVDDYETELKNVGRQFVLDERGLSHDEVLRRFYGLSEDVVAKLRFQQVKAKAVKIYVRADEVGTWQNFTRQSKAFNDESTLFTLVRQLFSSAPLPAYEIGVTCYGLTNEDQSQLELLDDSERTERLSGAIDQINSNHGARTVHSATTLGLGTHMKRKIPFGGVRYL